MRLQEERLKISSGMFVENFQDIAHLSRICTWNQKSLKKDHMCIVREGVENILSYVDF